jgi:hypothetical protein
MSSPVEVELLLAGFADPVRQLRAPLKRKG